MALPRQDLITSLGDQLNLLAGMLKTRSRAGMTDGNKILEPIIRKTFNTLFGWNLVNLNAERVNFPAADLGDKKLRLAIQVTNEDSSEKITLTAVKAQEHNLGTEFDKLIVFFLLAKKPGMPKRFRQSDEGPLIETWDNAEVLKRAAEIDDIEVIRAAVRILNEEIQPFVGTAPETTSVNTIGSGETTRFEHAAFGLESAEETLYASFFQVLFPEEIQTAVITLKRRVKFSERLVTAWRNLDTKNEPPVDYLIENGTVYTFDRFDKPIWRDLIENKSIKPESSFKSTSWSKSGLLAERNLFTKLLQRNLEQLCNHVGTEFKLSWSRELKCYIFQAKRDVAVGKLKVNALTKAGTREVFKAILNTLPGREGEIQHWKHQGFRHRFVNFGGNWFLNIEPFWAFTADGVANPSRMHASSSRNMKKPERNRAVLGHVMFWASLLCKEPDMLAPPASIRLVRPHKFSVAPSILDSAWKDIAPDDEKQILTADSKEELWLL
jgi:hypothetical protein